MRGTTISELVTSLSAVGVRKDMVCLVHSNLMQLGRMEAGVRGVLEAFQAVLGPNGTLIAPAFSYSAFRGEVYCPVSSPSRTGVLGAALADIGIRSGDPNFSLASTGSRASMFAKWWSGRPSIGPTSVFEDLLDANVFVVLLGVDFSALPLFMHLEVEAGLHYRYAKHFDARIKLEGAQVTVDAIHWVRDENLGPRTDRRRAGNKISSSSYCQDSSLVYGRCIGVPGSIVRSITLAELERDPLFLLHEDNPFSEGAIASAHRR